jgi:hypothetical protein
MEIYPLVSSHIMRTGQSPSLMGKSTISMAMFNSYVSLPEGKKHEWIIGGIQSRAPKRELSWLIMTYCKCAIFSM